MSNSAESRRGPTATAVAATIRKNFDHLRELLRQMFQLDRGDLDFGLYRIMRMKSDEVSAFLDQDLLPQVGKHLRLTTQEELARLEKQLEADVTAARQLGYHPDSSPAITTKRLRLAAMKQDVLAEADVYQHLTSFFSRYYSEGDFVSRLRRSSGDRTSYLIPYDGEEVTLYWANSDQYYIKTTENYASYVFRPDPGDSARRVRLEIASADNEKDNIRPSKPKERRFVLPQGAAALAVVGRELRIRFEHRPLTASEKRRWPGNGNHQQARINQATAERILKKAPGEWTVPLAAAAPTEANGDRTVLDRHLERYTAKNTFDYFIHKDLDRFLRRQLDLYLNTEILNLDDIEKGGAERLDRAFARARAVRHIGGKIITFLAQLEDFQKRLWLKKKLVLETQWCVTLDRIPESLYPEISKNEAQRKEWVRLFSIDTIAGNLGNGGAGYSMPLTPEFLRGNPFLVLDTGHFDRDFTDRLLAALSDSGPLCDQQDGLLVHGENSQALNLLRARYSGGIDCVYIDPPYNTDSSAILYKNDYKDSSWLSLMEERLRLCHDLLGSESAIAVAIDDEEVAHLHLLLRRLFRQELGVAVVRSNPAGRKAKGKLSPSHEFCLLFGTGLAAPGSFDKTDAEKARYPIVEGDRRAAWANLIRSGSNDRREDRPKLHYPIYVDNQDTLRVPRMRWNAERGEYAVLEKPKDDEAVVLPVVKRNGEIIEKNWHRGPDRIGVPPGDYRVRRTDGGPRDASTIRVDFKTYMHEESAPRTWWGDAKYASANLGAKSLKDLFGENGFSFAKAVPLVEDSLRAGRCDRQATVLDFFAGSGTTGHAVVNLNRGDAGERKYILVEMGAHFREVLLPRMKKVAYSRDWREGQPVGRAGVSQLFRYIDIESYEDTMEALERVPTTADGQELLETEAEVREDYHLRYALGEETNGSPCLLGREFRDPFAYTVSVVRDGERREVPVDLPTTFEFLLGLRVASRRRIEEVLAVAGVGGDGRRTLVLWRNLDRVDGKALDAWFERNRGAVAGGVEIIYANGDHSLNALRRKEETWVAETLDGKFRELMFSTEP